MMSAGLDPLGAALMGMVEGLTEFLPVSSTGHLILLQHWLGLANSPGLQAFEIVIQGGAILAVIGLYRARVREMVQGLSGRSPAGRRLLLLLLTAFAPAAILGPLLEKRIETLLFNPRAVATALAFGGILMLLLNRWRRRTNSKDDLLELSMGQALAIGLCQCLAMWPGMSRSMTTILAALGCGLSAPAAAEFSFLLALPTLGGATALKLLRHGGDLAQLGVLSNLIGLLVALVSALLAIRGFVTWLGKHGFVPFGVYRIALALAVYVAWVS